MLDLQIWISTVIRVALQFLTSTCGLLYEVGTKAYFYRRKHSNLASRIVVDLKFWRRFLSCEPEATFKNVLGLSPENNDILASETVE